MVIPAQKKVRLRPAVVTLLILMGGIVGVGPLNHLFGGPWIHPVAAALGPNNNLGIDCALGASADAPNPFPTPISTKDSDGVIDSNCQWTGDVDSDTHTPFPTFDPITSDSVNLTQQIGGGFIADIMFTNMNVTINGFDITLNYDPHVLDMVAFDQSGLTFGGNIGCPVANPNCTLTLAISMDRVNGVIRLAQVVSSIKVGPGGDVNVNSVTLFRLRFDVVGAGYSSIHFGSNIITAVFSGIQTGPARHYTFDASFSTQNIFNFVNAQPLAPSTAWFNASWSFSPNPEVPGSPLTFTATASCSYCTGALSYKWDFSSVDSSTYVSKVDGTGSTVTVTAPPPIINRVTLNVTSGSLYASATRLLPLAVGGVPNTIPVKVAAGVTGSWLGGVPSYSGSYIFCPALNPTDFSVCSKPTVTIPLGTQSQNKTAVLTYNFAGLYTSTLTITYSTPSQVGASTAVGSFLINVTGSPVVFAVSVASNASSVDIGQTVQYTATVTYNPNYPAALSSSGFLYFFSFGDGTNQTISLSRSATVTHTYSSGGTFTVRATAQETVRSSISKSKILESGYSTMIVNQPVSGNFTISSTSRQAGQAITFTATTSGGTGSYTYSWDFGDGTTGNGSSPAHTYASAGTYRVKLTTTDSYGASTSYNQTVTITAAPAPAFPLTYVVGGVIGALAIVAAALFLLRRRRKIPAAPV